MFKKKKKYFLALVLIVLLGDSCAAMENHIKVDEPGIYLYQRGKATLIKEKYGCPLIEFQEILVDALVLSDDLYLLSISPETIKAERKDGCLEIIFKETQTISMGAFDKRKREIKRILFPLGQMCGKGNFDVYFGDPEYDEFNIVINGNVPFRKKVCSFFKKCIEKELIYNRK